MHEILMHIFYYDPVTQPVGIARLNLPNKTNETYSAHVQQKVETRKDRTVIVYETAE